MKGKSGICRLALAGGVVLASLLVLGVASAWAESPTWLCVPKTAGKAVTSGGIGAEAKCEAETVTTELPPTAELPTLVDILSHMEYVASGVGSQPTIKFKGVNVQIVNGAGTTATTNGKGNLVIGYDEKPVLVTGSHNLVLGGEQSYTSYGGILGGFGNYVSQPFASITGGLGNTVTGSYGSVTGGWKNTVSASRASITGGYENTASELVASVSGGELNVASGGGSSVSGGIGNKAKSGTASVSGGSENLAEGQYSSIAGGKENKATAKYAAIFGGKELTAAKEFEACGGNPNVVGGVC
jgi:hypothetical protein